MIPDVHRDEQTGLPNALSFLEALSAAAAHPRPVALLLLELTAPGGTLPDAAVAAMADFLTTRPGIAAHRWGRERFAVLVPAPAAEGAAILGRELLTGYHQAVAPIDTAFGCRMGYAVRTGPFQPAELLAAATADLDPQSTHVADDVIARMVETLRQISHGPQTALTDPVSGLPNHRSMRRGLAAAVASAEQTGRPAAVLFVDGDTLRRYNEGGTEDGDAMIRRLGGLLRRCLRGQDVLGRWLSGDEFLVLLPGADRVQATACAQRLCDTVRREAAQWKIPVTISVGVAIHPEDGRNEEALLRSALAACTSAKRAGRDRVFLAADIR